MLLQKILKQNKPNYYCKGPDYISKKKDINLNKEVKIFKNNGKFITLKHKKYSSSDIIKVFKKYLIKDLEMFNLNLFNKK